jgi:hypothetical protein
MANITESLRAIKEKTKYWLSLKSHISLALQFWSGIMANIGKSTRAIKQQMYVCD